MSSAATVAATPVAVVDVDMTDTDDEMVEEYDFSNEPEDVEESDDGLDTAHYKNPNGAITVDDDSEDEAEEYLDVTKQYRPWRHPQFGLEARREYEKHLAPTPVRATYFDWEVTEGIWAERDKEMLRYLEDFPIEQWVIPRQEAQAAYERLMASQKWRSLGIKILGNRIHPMHAPQYYQHVPGMMPMRPPPPGYMHAMAPVPVQLQNRHGMPGPVYPNTHSPMPPHGPHGIPQPPPQRVLPSQNNSLAAQHMRPLPVMPGQMGPPQRPASARQAPQPQNGVRPASSKGKEKMVELPRSPQTEFPTNAKIPPYTPRARPSGRTVGNKPGRRYTRRQAEAERFPWNRDIDYVAERANVTWDDSMYDKDMLEEMAKTRARNAVTIKRTENDEETDEQRESRRTRRLSSNAGSESEAEKAKARPRSKGRKGKGSETATEIIRGDCYAFATKEDEEKGTATGFQTPEDIMNAYEDDKVSLETCADIKICWNPFKKGSTHLEHARFSIKDTVLTNAQLDTKPMLNRRAGECIIDFCPHMMFKETLLRFESEAGLTNKDIRDRLSRNGNFVDNSTLTKRIGSALGQKQQQSVTRMSKRKTAAPLDPANLKVKGYGQGEVTYYNNNVCDYDHYKIFFGHHSSHRSLLQFSRAASKRKQPSSDDVEDDEVEVISSGPAKKRARTEEATSPATIPSSESTLVEAEDGESGDEEGNEEFEDAVSVQSDTMLDEIED